MNIRTTKEDPIQIHDGLPFVNANTVAPGEHHIPAYEIEGPDNYTVAIEQNTPFAPEARTSSGDKIDGSTQVVLQKADPQGNPLGNAILFSHNLDAFDYEEMRSDPRFYRHTQKSLVLDEREYLHVYYQIPGNASTTFDPSMSNLTIGDNVTSTGKAVFIREKSSMTAAEKQAVSQASSK